MRRPFARWMGRESYGEPFFTNTDNEHDCRILYPCGAGAALAYEKASEIILVHFVDRRVFQAGLPGIGEQRFQPCEGSTADDTGGIRDTDTCGFK